MAFKLYDFECAECGAEWEELVDRDDPKDECLTCGAYPVPPCISPMKLMAYSMMSKEQKDDCLRIRSEKHTQEEIINKIPEKFGATGIARYQAGRIHSAGGLEKPKPKKKKARKKTKAAK